MKNKTTITISDVYGSKSYSFNQLIRKFFFLFFLIILTLILSGGFTIWWLNQEIGTVDKNMAAARSDYQSILEKKQTAYVTIKKENESFQTDIEDKRKQILFLDQTLQGLEKLIGGNPDQEELAVKDRVKLVQMSTLERQVMLQAIPSGRPVKLFQGVSSAYGWRKHPVTGERKFHRGIDYKGSKGDPVIVTADGVVEFAGYHKKSGFGNLIIIAHDNGFKTIYAHLNKVHVKTGQVLSKGEHIGNIGSTGLSSGDHLHYEVKFLARKLNPGPFIEWNIKNYQQIFKKIKGVPWGSLSQKVQNHVQMVEKQLLLRDVK